MKPNQVKSPPLGGGPIAGQATKRRWRTHNSLACSIVVLLTCALASWAVDLRNIINAQALTVSNTTNTPVRAQLQGATSVQMYIRPSSTAQIFTVTLADTTTIEVPSGASYTLRSATPFSSSDQICTIQTATSSAVLQVISTREIKE